MDNKEKHLTKIHRDLADEFGLAVEDVAIGFPMKKYDDAVRIYEGLNYINRGTGRHKMHGTLDVVVGGLVALFNIPAISSRSLTVGTSIAISMGVSALGHFTALGSAHFLRKDRKKDVLAAIEYGKTPEWIHRLARENKL